MQPHAFMMSYSLWDIEGQRFKKVSKQSVHKKVHITTPKRCIRRSDKHDSGQIVFLRKLSQRRASSFCERGSVKMKICMFMVMDGRCAHVHTAPCTTTTKPNNTVLIVLSLFIFLRYWKSIHFLNIFFGNICRHLCNGHRKRGPSLPANFHPLPAEFSQQTSPNAFPSQFLKKMIISFKNVFVF